jgi:hypothetical protein
MGKFKSLKNTSSKALTITFYTIHINNCQASTKQALPAFMQSTRLGTTNSQGTPVY